MTEENESKLTKEYELKMLSRIMDQDRERKRIWLNLSNGLLYSIIVGTSVGMVGAVGGMVTVNNGTSEKLIAILAFILSIVIVFGVSSMAMYLMFSEIDVIEKHLVKEFMTNNEMNFKKGLTLITEIPNEAFKLKPLLTRRKLVLVIGISTVLYAIMSLVLSLPHLWKNEITRFWCSFSLLAALLISIQLAYLLFYYHKTHKTIMTKSKNYIPKRNEN